MKNTIPTGTRAMIFAAGLGTRLKPFTDSHPKALAPINGKTLLQRSIEYLKDAGITDIIVNVHHFADQITDFILLNKKFGCEISISHEIEEPLETGGGLKKASWFFEESTLPFFIVNADILTNLNLEKMYAFHLKNKGLATLAITNRNSSRSFLFDKENLLCGWENKITGEKRMSKNNAELHQEGKFSIIDTYLELAKTQQIYGYDHSGDVVVDVGKPESIAIAEKYFL